MAWFVYDFDKDGKTYQSGPFFSESIAQAELDACESPKAEKHYWKTRNKAAAKGNWRLLVKHKQGLDKATEHIRRSRKSDTSEVTKNLISTDLGVELPDPYKDIRQIKTSVKEKTILTSI